MLFLHGSLEEHFYNGIPCLSKDSLIFEMIDWLVFRG